MIHVDRGNCSFEGSVQSILAELSTLVHTLHAKVGLPKEMLQYSLDIACKSSKELEKEVDDVISEQIKSGRGIASLLNAMVNEYGKEETADLLNSLFKEFDA